MNVIIIGPPGAGKGTQAAVVAGVCGMRHLSSGDLLRESARKGEELGLKAQEFMSSGELVPDNLMIELVVKEVARLAETGSGALLDGFPRTIEQARALLDSFVGNNIRLDKVIFLKASDEIVVERLCGRMVCPDCGAVYHIKLHSPAVAGRCDVCSNSELVVRADDREDVILQRLRVYRENTEPVLSFFRKRGFVFEVDSDRQSEEVSEDIIRELKRIGGS
jgi:adenylate kinase